MLKAMTKKNVLLFTWVLLFLAALTLQYFESVIGEHTPRRAGVEAGDWSKYGDIRVTWNTNDTNAKPPQELVATNNTAWVKLAVLNVTGTVVRYQNLTRFKDGNETTNVAWVDVESGVGTGLLDFIAANLTEGEGLYTDEPNSKMTFNETIEREYLGAQRFANHLSLNFTYQNSTSSQMIQYAFDFYWDRETGIITERQASILNRTGDFVTSWSRADKIVETSLWTSGSSEPPDTTPPPSSDTAGWVLPPWTANVAVLVFAAFVLLGVWWYTRAKHKMPKHRLRQRKHHKHL